MKAFLAALVLAGILIYGSTQKPTQRVSAELCDAEYTHCVYQDVPAAQFVGKAYVKDILACVAQPSVQVGDRCYLMNPSEVTK